MLQPFAQQLIRDLKASWQKTALLGLLLLVGFYFWIPPLVRAMRGGDASESNSSAAVTTDRPAVSAATVVEPSEESVADKPDLNWQQLAELRDTDPLLNSVEIASRNQSPFSVNEDQFPPIVVFAEEAHETFEKVESKIADAFQDPRTPERLKLKSTIIGTSRRAAWINNKLYNEGSTIADESGQYKIVRVESRSVTLSRDNQTFLLTIHDDHKPESIELRRTTKDTLLP